MVFTVCGASGTHGEGAQPWPSGPWECLSHPFTQVQTRSLLSRCFPGLQDTRVSVIYCDLAVSVARIPDHPLPSMPSKCPLFVSSRG